MDIERYLEEELELLHNRICSADKTIQDLTKISYNFNKIKANLDLSRQFSASGQNIQGYKYLLDALQIFIEINKDLVDALILPSGIVNGLS